MSGFLTLVRNLAPFLYAIAGGLLLWGALSFIKARAQLLQARFRLERESAEERGGRSITLSIIALQVLILVFLLSTTTFNAWQEFAGNVTATPIQQDIPFRTAIAVDVGGELIVPEREEEGLFLVSTPPPSPTPAGTLLPAPAPVGCIADQANISLPANGQVVFEIVPIMGTANISNFGQYRFEIRNVLTETQFGVIGGASSDHNVPVINGPLGSIVPQNFLPGEYRFRMVVFDNTVQMRAMCEITIFISDPPPTPTPIGGAPNPSGDNSGN